MKKTVAELNEAKRLKRERNEALAGDLLELFQLLQAMGRTIRTLKKKNQELEKYLSKYLGLDIRR